MSTLYQQRLYDEIIDGENYPIDDFINKVVTLRDFGYTHIEFSGNEYDLDVTVSRPKTPEEIEKETKVKQDMEARWTAQRLEQYKKLKEEFGELPE